MGDLKIFFMIVMVLVAKDGAFSCSLRSHKHGSSHPCLPSTSDSTSKSHLTPVSNTISSPFDSSSSPSSSSSSHADSSAISSTPTLSPDMSSPGSIPFIPTTSSASTDNTDILNSLIKLISPPAFSTLKAGKTSIPLSPYLSTFKPMPLSPPCPLFTSTSNKNVVPGKKPCSLSHPVGPFLSALPGELHGSPSSSDHSATATIPEKSPALTPAPVLEHELEIAPEEFPAPSNVPVSIPVVTSTSTPTSSYSYNPSFINILHKLLEVSQAKTGLSSSPLPTKTHVTPTFNATSESAPGIKPLTISPACGISPKSLSACSSSIIHNNSNDSISRLQQILMSMAPPPVSGISFGYNPEFMKLLIKNLLSNHTSSLPPLSSLNSILQAELNTTPAIVPLDSSPIPTSTSNRPLSELNPNIFNISSNNAFDSVPAGSDTNQNTSISNDQFLTNILINLLTSSNASKTSLFPCLPSTNPHSMSTLSTTSVSSVPCIPPFNSLPDILSKIPSLTPGSNPSFPGLIPSPIITSSPNIKPFSDRVKNLNLIPTLTPNLNPLSPSSDIDLCRSKHKKLLQLSSSTSTAVDPCLQNVIRPHTPHLPLPCSLSHTKLSSGCKH